MLVVNIDWRSRRFYNDMNRERDYHRRLAICRAYIRDLVMEAGIKLSSISPTEMNNGARCLNNAWFFAIRFEPNHPRPAV